MNEKNEGLARLSGEINPRRIFSWGIEAALLGITGQIGDWIATPFPEHLRFYIKITTIVATTSLLLIAEFRWFWWLSFERISSRWKAAKWAGLSRVYPIKNNPTGNIGTNATINTEQQTMAKEALRNLVAVENEIDMLLTSGLYYIGNAKFNGILRDVLYKRTARNPLKLRILLLNPDGKEAPKRAKELNTSEETYKENIRATLWTLAELRNALGLPVEVYLYDEAPVWQMVVTKKELWLLSARKMAADVSTVYCIQREGDYSLGWELHEIWERVQKNATPIDWPNYIIPKPDWEKVSDATTA